MLDKLIKIFNAKSTFHLILIFFIFGITGSLSLFISDPFLKIIKLDEFISFYPIYFIVRLLIIFPIYNILLIFFGLIFGEFEYFWRIEKKIFKRLGINL